MKRMSAIIATICLMVSALAFGAPVAQADPSDFVVTDSVNAGDHGTISVTNSTLQDDEVDLQFWRYNADSSEPATAVVKVSAGQTATYDWSSPSNTSGAQWVFTEISATAKSSQATVFTQSVPYTAGVINAEFSVDTTCGTDFDLAVANGLATEQSVYWKAQGNSGHPATVSDLLSFEPYGSSATSSNTNRIVFGSFSPGDGDSTYIVTLYNSADNSVVAVSPSIKVNCPPGPVLTSGPKLSRAPRVGSPVTCLATVVFYGTHPATAYFWIVNGKTNGAETKTYTPKVADLGKKLSCGVSYADDNGGGIDLGTPTKVSAGLAPKLTTAKHGPWITGVPARGKNLSVSVGRWSPKFKYVYKYQLFRVVGKKLVPASKLVPATTLFKVPKSFKKGTKLVAKVLVCRVGYVTGVAVTPAVTVS